MIYIIAGAPRLGKSTIAQRLMKVTGSPWLSTDILRKVAFAYASDTDIRFPLSTLGNREEMGTRSAQSLVDMFIQEAQSMKAGIEKCLQYQISVNQDFILEGIHILPQDLYEIMTRRGWDEHIAVQFLGCRDKELQLEAMQKNTDTSDWLVDASEEVYENMAQVITLYSGQIKKDCAKYDFAYLERTGDFELENKKITTALVEKIR